MVQAPADQWIGEGVKGEAKPSTKCRQNPDGFVDNSISTGYPITWLFNCLSKFIETTKAKQSTI